jgi:hypothetical protein
MRYQQLVFSQVFLVSVGVC